jgi:hypothetical protein
VDDESVSKVEELVVFKEPTLFDKIREFFAYKSLLIFDVNTRIRQVCLLLVSPNDDENPQVKEKEQK